MDAGSIIVTGLETEVVIDAIKLQTSSDILAKPMYVPEDYRIENTSHRVVKIMMGTHKISPLWDNIRYNDLA